MKKKIEKYNNVLGIDIGGATRMGLSLYSNNDNKLLYYNTIRRVDVKNNLQHRLNLVNEIKRLSNTYKIDILLFESIRLFSYGNIQLQTILSLNKVQTTIINEFSDKFPIYQIDVRSWKSKVLGSAKADKNDSISYVRRKYPNVNIIDEIVRPRKKEIELELNHDLCDAICISHVLKLDSSILQDKNKLNYK